jgi:hypothetical protein
VNESTTKGKLCPGSGGTVNPQDLCHVCKQKVPVYLPNENGRYVSYRAVDHEAPNELE